MYSIIDSITVHLCGAHVQAVKALDLRSRGLRFDSRGAGHVYKHWGKLGVHTASVHTTVMGTRWNEKLVLRE